MLVFYTFSVSLQAEIISNLAEGIYFSSFEISLKAFTTNYMYIVCVELCKFMFLVLTFLLLLSVGCCEVYERIVAVYDETGTFWCNL